MTWILPISVPSGGYFYAMKWKEGPGGWHTTIVKENATRFKTKNEAEAAALHYAATNPLFLNRVSVEEEMAASEWVVTSVDGFYSNGEYNFETAPGYAARYKTKEEAEAIAVLIAAKDPARIGFLHIVEWNAKCGS